MDENVGLLAKLQELNLAYAATLPDQVVQFAAGVRRLKREQDVTEAQQQRERLRDLAHKLAGSAGLHGFPEVSAWGKRAQTLCRDGSAEELEASARALAELISAQRG